MSEHDSSSTQRPGASRPGPGPAGMPRWVKVALIVLAALAVLVVVALLNGHGPGLHAYALPNPQPVATVALPEVPARWL